jgi:hypothetical protein
MSLIYRNRSIINQRGGTILIDNTTDQEKVKISHRSGSNLNFTNVVTSELATNNKQLNVTNDYFETVGGDKLEFCGKNHTYRTGENIYHIKGFLNQEQLDAFTKWKDVYRKIAILNGEFKVERGGFGFPNGNSKGPAGTRATNPVIGSKVYTVENTFNGYSGSPIRRSDQDDVLHFSKVIDHGKTEAAKQQSISTSDINKSAGSSGSKAPGIMEFGPTKSAATEQGTWSTNLPGIKIGDEILNLQEDLNSIEEMMGDGGDETYFTKRHKFEQVGAEFNDYPSIRIDEKGRSQPLEMLVSDKGVYKNHDYAPHVEEVDNASSFPCGNDDKIIGNRYSRTSGSGGMQFKTSGVVELGGSRLTGGFKAVNLNASHGIQIASEAYVELQSIKSIILRTNRQVYVESGLGVKGNLIVGGGAYIEGETYLQHITAPLEVHKTEDTTVFGKFATNGEPLVIGYVNLGGTSHPVFASSADNLIQCYAHSHHHHGIPMRLTKSNKGVRDFAQKEQINNHTNISQALAQNHEHKYPQGD